MLDRYEIISAIGEGGIGRVYKALDRQLKRFVAIKRLHRRSPDNESGTDEEEKRLLQEASLTCAIQHTNIVSVFDGGVDEEGAYLVMEYVEGETLSEVIRRGTLTFDDFCRVVSQTLEGMSAAQEKGLLHRDLKPSNLMISWLPSGSYRIKILDFGMAKYAPIPTHQTTDHKRGIYGSIHFMAPEQFNLARLDPRTDLYALGCIYYYALTGMYPFDGESVEDIMKAHLQGRVVPVHYVRRDLPHPVGHWLMGLISRDMTDRPRSALETLEKFQVSLPSNTARVSLQSNYFHGLRAVATA